jgi:CubicO group peptidase (beta-lactamase class C family)
MRLSRRCSSLAPILLLASSSPADDGAARRSQVRELLEAQRQQLHIPGLAYAVVQDDAVVALGALGLRDIERNQPATPDTVFPIGSCTKAFTSMAVAMSQDRRLLALDDRPRRHLPYFRMKDPDADARVRVVDMLAHRTGLKAYADLAAEPGILTREEYVRAATAAKPVAPFGTKFQYSNAMYSAVGEILGRGHGTTWEEVVRRLVFQPLAMRSSTAQMSAWAAFPDHATGYVYDAARERWTAAPPPRSLAALAPGGSIASSARDMAQWLRLLTGGGVVGGQRLVSEAGFRAVVSPRTEIRPDLSYALGWATYEWNGERVLEHNGGSQGLSALVSFMPARRVGFVLLANSSPTTLTKITVAGEMLWPVLLARAGSPAGAGSTLPPATSPAVATSPDARLPAAPELLERMIAAVGGVTVLRRHTSMEVRARKSYENHGVDATLRIVAAQPARRAEEERWHAAGRRIAWLRVWFDGSHGAQDTTFGQDSENDAAADARARRENAFRELLDLPTLYRRISVAGVTSIDGQRAYDLELEASDGTRSRLAVDARTGLILRRVTDAGTVSYADYRTVDGERVPFLARIDDPALGEITIRTEKVWFNRRLDARAFTAARRRPEL